MTDKEILAELKKSYEYLRDIRENGCADHCTGQMEKNIDKLDKVFEDIGVIYNDFYNTLDKEELRINRRVLTNKIYVSDDVSRDYDVYELDENPDNVNYVSAYDLDYFWYEDKDFLER